MQYENWNFENDLIVTNASLMFPKNTARNYMGTAYAVETENGVFYQKLREDGNFNLMLVDQHGENVFVEDVVVVASDMKYTCIIVHLVKSGEYYLIDTRGIFFLLEVTKDNVGPAAYRMTLNRNTGFYEVGTKNHVRWILRGISKQKQFSIMMESAPSGNWTLNPKFKSIFSKKNAGDYFYLTIPKGKKGQMIECLLATGLHHEQIPNIFVEDDSKNIRIPINELTVANKALHFAMAKYHNTYAIAGIPLEIFMGTLEFDNKVKKQLGVYMRPATDAQYPKVMSIASTLKMLYEVETDMDLYKKVFKRLLGAFTSSKDLGFENIFESLILPYPDSSFHGLNENIRIMQDRKEYIINNLGFTSLLSDLNTTDHIGAYQLYKKIYDASKNYYKAQLADYEASVRTV